MMFQKIFRSPQLQPITINESKSCPNCWGYSKWECQDKPAFFDIDKGQRAEVNSRNGFIRRFVKQFVA